MASQNKKYTIFLTEQEAERIRTTAKETVKKCSELVGHTREARDAKTAISQATGASLMADMGTTQMNGRGDSLPALSVGQPYPPCTLSLQDLQPMKLSQLQIDTHHRGRRLTVKRASPVVTLVARSWAMVQDEEEDTERIEVCLHKARHGEDILESSSHFIIKEPYFTLTEEGEATLRIDHPSDLIICRNNIADENLISACDADTAEKLARKCKEAGNAALKQQDLPLAHSRYTEGLKIAGKEKSNKNPDLADLARDIFRNRAHINLLLNQLDEAISDAQASLIGREDQRSKELDGKAYFRAGSAAYSLGEYDKAKAFFEEQLKFMPEDKSAGVYLRQTEVRLREQMTGVYNWTKIKAGLSPARPRVQAASFTSNTKVGASPGRGNGLFVTRDIPTGDIVMCDKAFCVVWGHEGETLTAMTYDLRDDRIRVSAVGLIASTVQKLLGNPTCIERVMELYGDYQGDGKNVSRTEDGPVVDTFRVHDIVSRNAFGPGSQYLEEGARDASTGLWIWAAYINHSCVANLRKEFVGDLMVLRATRPISVGEEIFISYDESSDYDTRRTALMTTWGFECDCALCAVERADDPAVRKKRRELAKEADGFVEREPWENVKRITIAKAQRLARAIDETYDDERYKNVPRVAGRTIQDWLTKASPRR
jgi:tetratricopeptide (TPR) repeat protein